MRLAVHDQFPVSNQTSSLVVFQRMPLRRIFHSRPVPGPISKNESLRPIAAKRWTPSALTVPPGFGGLLRVWTCKFVAPCIRPWGSSGFVCGLAHVAFPHHSLLQSLLTLAFVPFEAFPLSIAAPRHRVAFPSRRYPATPKIGAAVRDLRALLHLQVRLPRLCCHSFRLDAPLGFVPLQGAPFTPSAPVSPPGAHSLVRIRPGHVHRGNRGLDVPVTV